MTVFENISSKNIDELVEWLCENGAYGNTPWDNWYDKNYCRNCGSVTTNSVTDSYGDYWEGNHEFSWCELYGNCRYFQNLNRTPNRKQTIRLWLESEVN